MGKKNKKSTPVQDKKKPDNRIVIEFSLKKLLGRIPVPKCGFSIAPKKGKGAKYNRKKEKSSWKGDKW